MKTKTLPTSLLMTMEMKLNTNTPREQLKQLGLDYHKIAEFFNMSPSSFKNSSARERYESAILKAIQYIKNIENN